MDEFFKQLLEDRPCNKCGRAVRCPGKCNQYEDWFRVVWRELRVMYLGPDRARR